MATNGEGQEVATRAGAVATREEFGATAITPTVETASVAVAAQARAVAETRAIMAMKRPRDIEEARQAILKACRRPGFAEESLYRKPVGGNETIEGLSIRFAEEAVRSMRNIEVETVTLYDDPTKRILKISAVDLEANVPYSDTLVIEKTVERRRVRDGQTVLSERVGSGGHKVYLIEASESEVRTKQAAEVSKAIRTLVLRLLPGDIKAEAEALIRETLKNRAAKDPDAERKLVADAFAQVRVSPADLREYLGHALDKCTPTELVQLRAVYAALRDGEATWPEILATKTGDAQNAKAQTEATAAKMKEAAAKKTETKPASESAQTPKEPEGLAVDAGESASGGDDTDMFNPSK